MLQFKYKFLSGPLRCLSGPKGAMTCRRFWLKKIQTNADDLFWVQNETLMSCYIVIWNKLCVHWYYGSLRGNCATLRVNWNSTCKMFCQELCTIALICSSSTAADTPKLYYCQKQKLPCAQSTRLKRYDNWVDRQLWPSTNQRSGRFLGMIGCDLDVCKSDRLHVHILQFSFFKIGVYSSNSSRMISNFPAVLNLNWIFLKLNRFICN